MSTPLNHELKLDPEDGRIWLRCQEPSHEWAEEIRTPDDVASATIRHRAAVRDAMQPGVYEVTDPDALMVLLPDGRWRLARFDGASEPVLERLVFLGPSAVVETIQKRVRP